MIILVIGQSASGKTTWVKKNYLGNGVENFLELVMHAKPVKHTIFGKTMALGYYNIGRRCEGTDTIAYNALPEIIKFVEENASNYDVIIAEGDRVNNKAFINLIKKLGGKIVLFECSIETSLKRLKEASSKITETFVKATKTKALNNAKYASSIGLIIEKINTEVEKNGLSKFT